MDVGAVEENHGRGKDRPVLVVAREAVMALSQRSGFCRKCRGDISTE